MNIIILHFGYTAYTCSISEMQNYNNNNIQPPMSKKLPREKVFWGDIMVGVKYNISAFLIYFILAKSS